MVETTTTTTEEAPNAFAQPYLQYGMAEAMRQYQEGAPQFYQGQTYAGYTPQQEQALEAQQARALAGSPLTQQAQSTLGSFLGSTGAEGQYVPPAQSGLLTGAINRALAPVQQNVESALAQRGRTGSAAGARAMTEAMGNVAADVAYRDYATQRGLGLQAAQLAPSMAAQDYYDIGQLGQVGAQRQQQAQMGIDEAMQRYQYNQLAPQQQLQQYQNLIAGFPMGGTTTQVTPYYQPSSGQQFLGGYLGAAGAGIENPYLRLGAGLLARD